MSVKNGVRVRYSVVSTFTVVSIWNIWNNGTMFIIILYYALNLRPLNIGLNFQKLRIDNAYQRMWVCNCCWRTHSIDGVKHPYDNVYLKVASYTQKCLISFNMWDLNVPFLRCFWVIIFFVLNCIQFAIILCKNIYANNLPILKTPLTHSVDLSSLRPQCPSYPLYSRKK